jgi:FkbM family methyltransferase
LNRSARLAALRRFIRWQFASRLSPGSLVVPFVDDTRLIVHRGMTGATGNIYCGLHEPAEMAFLLHALRPGELFVDIGMNVGSYTVMAAGAIGARTISVEPVPTTMERARDNIRLNDLGGLVDLRRCGVSSQAGTLPFSTLYDTTNRVVETELPGETITVPVVTLDQLCSGSHPAVVKIDVEGHEPHVIRGGRATLSSPSVKAVIMETNGCSIREGVTRESLIDAVIELGFGPYTYEPFSRRFRACEAGMSNTIFLRNRAEMEATCKSAPKFRLINGYI